MTRRLLIWTLPFWLAKKAPTQQKYSGPRPPKKDIPYLLQADKLIETEVQEATTSKSKDGQVFSVSGSTSSARTPLPEPIFLFLADAVNPGQLGLYRFQVNGGRRQVILGKRNSDDDQDLRLTLRQIDSGLYRIEASHMLDPGEYSLSPQGVNTAFCFTVY